MKNKVVSIIFYLMSILFLLYYCFVETSSNMFMSTFGRLFLLCGSCLFLYLGSLFLSRYRDDNKAMKISLWLFFVLYLVLLITLTLFDPMWGRNGVLFNWSKEEFYNYIENSVNLIPFKTIIGYVKGIFKSLLDTKNIFANLFGNIVCMMPFGLFLPLLFKKINNTKMFLLSILCITLGIELIQFFTFSGSCDIDDVILNISGALIMYRIICIKDLNNLVRNIFLLEKNKLNKKVIIYISIVIFIIGISYFGFYKIGSKYYNDNLDDWLSKRNYKLEIIDESETCAESLEKFYETELYEYYFECIKSDFVYAKINDGKKYLVKELLNNNPTDYIISIEKIKNAGLNFIKKEKYMKIELEFRSNSYIDNERIEDERILKIGWGTSIDDTKKQLQEVFLIPMKEGATYLSFDIYDSSTSILIDTLKYEVIINSNLEITYKEIK